MTGHAFLDLQKILIIAVLKWWLLQLRETENSFVFMMY